MSWLSSVITGVITAALGLVLSGYVATMAIRWYSISGFEGKSGYYMVAMALLGMFAGLVIGVIVSRVVAATANPSLLKALVLSLGTMSLLVAIVGGVGRLKADVPPTIDGEALMLMVEVRWPATQTESPATTPGISYLELGSVSSRVQRASQKGALWKEDAHLVDGRWVVPGAVFLFTERGDRVITAALNDSSRSGLQILLPKRPGTSDLEWSDWGPRDGRNGPTKEDGITYRYRVQKQSLPIRTETIGQFTVAAIANGFYPDIPEGTTTLDPYAQFDVTYAGKLVEFTASGSTVKRPARIALLPSAKPALLVYVELPASDGYCALLVDEGARYREEKLNDCSHLNAEELNPDRASTGDGASVIPARGRVDRRTYANSALLLFRNVVLNARTLTIRRM